MAERMFIVEQKKREPKVGVPKRKRAQPLHQYVCTVNFKGSELRIEAKASRIEQAIANVEITYGQGSVKRAELLK
jgi:hypothetical protein